MFKFLYKTLLIALMSGSMSVLPINSAMADTTTSMTTDSSGNTTTTTKYDFEKLKNSDMIASIAMLAGGAIATRMAINYKPVTTDVMIAAAGGAAFIAGEVLSNVKYKGTIDKMTVEVERKNDGTINEEQVQRLQDLKKSYEEAKSATKTKKTLQMASAAAFAAAALTATYMAMTEDASAAICKGAIAASTAALTSCMASGAFGVTAAEAAACKACSLQITEYSSSYTKLLAFRSATSASEAMQASTEADYLTLTTPAKFCAAIKGATNSAVTAKMSACSKSLFTQKSNNTSGSPAKGSFLKIPGQKIYTEFMKSQDSGFLEKMLNVFFPRANASWLPLLGLAASTVAAYTLVTKSLAVEIDFMMFIPRNRAIAFGVFAGLAYAAAKSSDNVIQTIEGNIAKIDRILADLAKQGVGVKVASVKAQALTTQALNTGVSYSTDGKTSSPCLTVSSSSNCASVSSVITTTTGFDSLPESIQSLATGTAKVADGVSGTSSISGATLAAAESLGNKQAAIKNLLRKAQESQLKDSKTTAAEQEGKFLESLGAKVKSSLGQKGLTPSGFLASVGTSAIDSTQINKNATAETATGKASGANVPAAIDIGTSSKDAFKLDFSDKASGDLAMANTGTSSSGIQYEITGDEIGKENGPSLFETISSRYLKSGYPKLLEVESTPKK